MTDRPEPEEAAETPPVVVPSEDDIASAQMLRRQIASGIAMLSTVGAELHQMLEDAASGSAKALKAVPGQQSELAKILRQAIDTERAYHVWAAKSATVSTPGADIDFDRVRAEIRGRLDSLRQKIGSRDVPGGDG